MKFNKFLAITMIAISPSMQYASSAMVKSARSAAPLVARLGASSTVAPAVGSSVASSPLAGQTRNYITPSYFDANKKAIDSKIQEGIDKYDIFNDDNDDDTQNQKDIDSLKNKGLLATNLKNDYQAAYNDLRNSFNVEPIGGKTYSLIHPQRTQNSTSSQRKADEDNIQLAGKTMKSVETTGKMATIDNSRGGRIDLPVKVTPEMKSNIKSKLEAYKTARAAVDKFLAENPEPTQENSEPAVEDSSVKS